MSSGSTRDYAGARAALDAASSLIIDPRELDRMRVVGMSERQRRLNHLWAHFTTLQYDARGVRWDGGQHLDPVEREAVATQKQLPPGFYDAAESVPLAFRRPSAPYHIFRVIAKRFTGLLFSERRHPRISVPGDQDLEDYLTALIKQGRLWQNMIEARNYGGACGSVAVGFSFIAGRPVIEIHDPRWSFPKFKDRTTLDLEAIEVRRMYGVEERDEKGAWRETPHWYRRVIDERDDRVWEAVPVDKGEEPNWDAIEPDQDVRHDFGFCPVRWIQNTPVSDDVDGESDCIGVLDMIEQMDTMISQALQGIVLNADPTVVLEAVEDSPMPELKKGSFNAIKLPKGSAKYLEMGGGALKLALEAAGHLRSWILEVAQCVLEEPDVANRTATEIDRRYSSMFERADVLREQYGQQGVLPLLDMMLRAVRVMDQVRINGDGRPERRVVKLPPRVVLDPKTKESRLEPRELPPDQGAQVEIAWPRYFDPSLDEAHKSVQTAGAALGGGLVDLEHAVRFVAEHFKVENVAELIEVLKRQKDEEQKRQEQQMMGALGGFPGAPM